jgi:hypothetical protein
MSGEFGQRLKPVEQRDRPKLLRYRPTSRVNELPSPMYQTAAGRPVRGLNEQEIEHMIVTVRQIWLLRTGRLLSVAAE